MKMETKYRKDGEPCSHPGCISHHTHPCEGCGRKYAVGEYIPRKNTFLIDNDSTTGNNEDKFRTCKYCGMKNLGWKRVGTTRRLFEGEEVHECGIGRALANAKRAFEKFVSGKKQSDSIGGQMVGCESYRLLFTGFHESMVWEALEDLEKEIQDANKD